MPPHLVTPKIQHQTLDHTIDPGSYTHTSLASSTPWTSLNLTVFPSVGSNWDWRGPAFMKPVFSKKTDKMTRKTNRPCPKRKKHKTRTCVREDRLTERADNNQDDKPNNSRDPCTLSCDEKNCLYAGCATVAVAYVQL
jgi:hypothetical protein